MESITRPHREDRDRRFGARLGLVACVLTVVCSAPAVAQNELPPVSGDQLERAFNSSRPDHRVVLESVDGSSSFILQAAGRVEPADDQLLGFDLSRPDSLSIEDGLVSGQLTHGAVGFRVYGPIRELILGQPSSLRVHVDVENADAETDAPQGQAAGTSHAAEVELQPASRLTRVESQPQEDEDEQATGPEWRFVPGAETILTNRAGAGEVDRTRRLEYSQNALAGIAMEEVGDRPCFLRLYASGNDDDIAQPYIGCGTTFSELGPDGPDQARNSRRIARLPPDYAVVGLEVCLNKSGRNARVKGIEVRGWRPAEYLDTDLDRQARMAREGFSRPNCREREFVSCPRRTIATGVKATLRVRGKTRNWVNGLRLICRPIEER